MATEIRPGDRFDCDGFDIAWAFVVYAEIQYWPGYLVGSDGSVWSRRLRGVRTSGKLSGGWKKLRPQTTRVGYERLTLSVRNRRRYAHVHELVLEAFAGPRPLGFEACHYDGNRTNNKFWNLRWAAKAANAADRIRHGTDPAGERNPNSKVTDAQVEEIAARYFAGESSRELSRRFGLHRTAIPRIVKRSAEFWRRKGGKGREVA